MNTATLKALADPSRLKMVELLREESLTVGEIADRLQLRQPQASKHLRILREAGLVEVVPEANRHRFRVRPEPLMEMNAWLESFRDMWEGRFEHLSEYLRRMDRT
ncbi:Helix-turn-helix domain-containing protein [Paenibacillus sp. UNC496MF]|uniref:ArsR/SmtB family transcription factor n=1 Tax=Paenibacillus sp. UNC496MF TaxID=1502753 RepID=UPI0008E44BF2|nr:metalloregulator ArsR/SmtB family transcription factor [Paenibacillus sp. UNC496MF]SFI69314.1 Helix-turn-helix domain-containing protein [Paenibacillus sp. UNC496MF]